MAYSSKLLNQLGRSTRSSKKKRFDFSDLNEKYFSSNKEKTTDTTDNLVQQAVNYETRLEAINADGKDTRNPLEKLLNLPEDQNFLFDIGELLDRPFNAIKGGIQEAQEGGSVGEGLLNGISGEKTYYAGDILRNAGVSDDPLFQNPLNGEDVSTADIAGTILDIFADPTSYIPVGAVAKGVNVANKGRALTKATKALNTAQDTLSTLKAADTAVDTLSDAQKAYNSLKLIDATNAVSDATKIQNAAKSAYELAQNLPAPKISLQDAAVQGLVGGVKKVAKGADTLITKGLSKLDDRALRNLVNSGASAKDIVTASRLSDVYQGAKSSIRRTADFAQSLPNNLVGKVKSQDNAIDAAGVVTAKRMQDIKGEISQYITKSGSKLKNSDEVEEAIEEVYSALNKSETTNAYSFFSDAANKKGSTFKLEGDYKDLSKVADTINNANLNGKRFSNVTLKAIPVKDENGKVVSGILELSDLKKGGRTTLKNILKNDEMSNYLKNIDIPTPVQIKDTAKAQEYNNKVAKYLDAYNNDSEFRKIYDDSINTMNEYVDNLYTASNGRIDFNEITKNNKGYLRKGLVEKIANNRYKTFGSAEYGNMSALKANIVRGERKMEEAAKKGDIINTLEASKSGVRQQRIGEKITETQAKLTDRQELSKAITKVKSNTLSENEIASLKKGLSTTSQRKLDTFVKTKKSESKWANIKKVKEQALADYPDKLGPELTKKITKTQNTKLAKSYINDMNSYNSSLKKASKLETKISKALDNGEDVSKMMTELDGVYNDALKYSRNMDFTKNQLEGTLTNDMTKKMNNVVNNSSNWTKSAINATTKNKNAAARLKTLDEANNDMISQLDKKLNDLKIQYANANPKLESNILNDRMIDSRISRIQREKELLESEAGKKFFSTSYFDGLGDFVKYSQQQAKDALGYARVLTDVGLNDTNILKFVNGDEWTRAVSTRGINGKVTVSKNEMNQMLKLLDVDKNLLSDDIVAGLNDFTERLKAADGVVMDRSAYELIMRNKNMAQSANALLKVYDGVNDTFKTMSTTSLGFHLRNIFGNLSNMFLSGMPIRSMPGEFATANRVLNSDYMWNLMKNGAKTATEKSDLKLLNEFINNGFLGQGKEIRDLQSLINRFGKAEMSESKFKQVFSKIFDANVKANEFIDARSRMMVLDYAMKNPDYMSKLGVKTAGDAVRFTVFDPSNLSTFEKTKIKKIIPFYTFTKQNLLFQAKNLLKNPSKYRELVKAIDLAYGSLDDTQYRSYQKDSMQIPIYTDEKGNTVTLKTNLPASDLGEWVENPLQRLVSSTSPLIRTPFEVVSGVDMYTGQESNNTPVDYLSNLLGLSNITRIRNRIPNISSDNTTAGNLSNIFGSVASYNDSSKIATSNIYEELEKYQEYIDELKSKGINVPTLAELEEQGVDVDAVREQIANDDSMLRKLKRARDRIQKSLGN